MVTPNSSSSGAWRWIPTLYFGQGIPFVVVMTVSVVMYKNLQVSNADIALYTSWLYLPWVIKPLWSPLVDLVQRKRWWIVGMQFLIGAAFALVALTIPSSDFFRYSLAGLWLIAFSSATHDIAADGFYLLALPPHQQSAFVGVRSTCFRLAMIAGQGGLVWLAGSLQLVAGDAARAWLGVFVLLAFFFGGLGFYHFFRLPRPPADQPGSHEIGPGWLAVFVSFFRKKDLLRVLGFLLLYRFAEAQLVKLVAPFLLDGREVGGLGLTNQQVGVIYGTTGVIALLCGGLAGGLMISRWGLKRMLWPMVISINVPNAVFVFLALVQPTNTALIGSVLAVEQLGYGFGFTAYLVFMMCVAEGEHKTAHYALCTGFMALGMMLPGMTAGWIEERLGYATFFFWVCLATIPSFLATTLIRVDPAYGRKIPAA